MDPRDDGLRARVDGLEGIGHPLRVRDVLLPRQLSARGHPVEVGAGTERRPGAAQHDHPHVVVVGEVTERLQ